MKSDVFSAIEAERYAKFCGTASVRMSCLEYSSSVPTSVDARNKGSLKSMLYEEKDRLEGGRHRATAVIGQDDLDFALRQAGVPLESLLAGVVPCPQIELPSGTKLVCIKGRDILAAAEEVLEGSDKRWVADLFLDDLSDSLRRLLTEEYDHQYVPTDGEFYRKIRGYQGIGGSPVDPFFESLWMGRLAESRNRKNNFMCLIDHKEYAKAFDNLLEIPALMCGMRFSAIKDVVYMHCDENLGYLRNVYQWWKEACGEDRQMMRDLPEHAIEELQGRAPGACRKDHDELLGKLEMICHSFSEQQRRTLWGNVCNKSRSCLIPSLFTFFEDCKFLANAAKCIRPIMNECASGSIGSNLRDMLQTGGDDEEPGQCIVQVSATSFGRVPGDAARRRLLAMHQIWLAAFRLCDEITTKTHRRNALAKPRSDTSEVAICKFAALASRLGFKSRNIERLCRTSPDQLIAERALIAARDPRFFHYQDKERCVHRVAEVFKVAVPNLGGSGSRPGDVVLREQPPKRHGLPYGTHHEKDKSRLFLPQLEKGQQGGDWDVSSTFVRWSVYAAYFGRPPSVADCLVDSDDQQARPLPSLDRVELSVSAIRQALQPEEHSQAVEDAQSELARLRALVTAEQEDLNDKEVLLDRANAELQRLEGRQREEQQKLYHLLQRIREAEEKLREPAAGTYEAGEAVPVDVLESRLVEPEAEAEAEDAIDEGEDIGTAADRFTQFDFARLAKEQNETRREEGRSKARIKFKLLHDDGTWEIARVVDAERAAVLRVAGEYVREGRLLFDENGNNVTVRTCFDRVVGSETKCVLVKTVAQASTVHRGL